MRIASIMLALLICLASLITSYTYAFADDIVLSNPYDFNKRLIRFDKTSPKLVWTTIQIPSAPVRAKAVILNLHVCVEGRISETDATEVGLKLRKPGTADPVGMAVNQRAMADGNCILEKSTVFIPLNANKQIEYWLDYNLSGSANDNLDLDVEVQGFVVRERN